jgi:predicted nucleotidyltransferase
LSVILRKKLEALDEYLRWLRESVKLRLVILFGSLARGSWTEASDIDLLIASDELGEDIWDNYARLKRPGIEPFAFNADALLREVDRPNLLVMDALEYGRVLFADEVYLSELMGRFTRAKARLGLRWTGETWAWADKGLGGP